MLLMSRQSRDSSSKQGAKACARNTKYVNAIILQHDCANKQTIDYKSDNY